MKLFKERLLIVSKRCAKVIGLFTLVLLIGVIMSVVDSLLPSFFFILSVVVLLLIITSGFCVLVKWLFIEPCKVHKNVKNEHSTKFKAN